MKTLLLGMVAAVLLLAFTYELWQFLGSSTESDRGGTEAPTIASVAESAGVGSHRFGSEPDGTNEDYSAILKNWQETKKTHLRALSKVKTTQDQRKIPASLAPQPGDYASRFVRFAEWNPNAAEAFDALCWAAVAAPDTEAGQKALALLRAGRMDLASAADLKQALAVAPLPANRPVPLAVDVLRLAKQDLRNPEALALVLWVCRNYYRINSPKDLGLFSDAAGIVVDRFVESAEISRFCECLGSLEGSPPWAPQFEQHLRTILKRNKHVGVRMHAHFALVLVVKNQDQPPFRETEALLQLLLTDYEMYAETYMEKTLVEKARSILKSLHQKK